MSWTTRTGMRLLFWLADNLLGDALSQERRADLKSIMASFNNESMNCKEKL